jgi:hypothetical protein
VCVVVDLHEEVAVLDFDGSARCLDNDVHWLIIFKGLQK